MWIPLTIAATAAYYLFRHPTKFEMRGNRMYLAALENKSVMGDDKVPAATVVTSELNAGGLTLLQGIDRSPKNPAQWNALVRTTVNVGLPVTIPAVNGGTRILSLKDVGASPMVQS